MGGEQRGCRMVQRASERQVLRSPVDERPDAKADDAGPQRAHVQHHIHRLPGDDDARVLGAKKAGCEHEPDAGGADLLQGVTTRKRARIA